MRKSTIFYRITPTPKFSLQNKWYEKLKDEEASGYVYFCPTKGSAASWASLIKKEIGLRQVYVHKVSILGYPQIRETFTYKGKRYTEIKIPNMGIFRAEVKETYKL